VRLVIERERGPLSVQIAAHFERISCGERAPLITAESHLRHLLMRRLTAWKSLENLRPQPPRSVPRSEPKVHALGWLNAVISFSALSHLSACVFLFNAADSRSATGNSAWHSALLLLSVNMSRVDK
jgi:hypothetical protein